MCNDPAMAAPVPHEVAVLALETTVAFELGLPHAFLGGAVDADGRPLYRVRVATVDGGPVRTCAGYQVLPDHDARACWRPPTPSSSRASTAARERDGTLPRRSPTRCAGRRAHARVVSICTGAFVLAAAGLLDGRPATTHWMHAAAFSGLFPQVHLDPDVLFVDDGDVLTSAGNAAGIDLLLHVVRRDHGSEVANRVARRSVVAPWRDGGQSQFIERPLPEPDGAGTADTRAWALARLGEPLTLAELAGARPDERAHLHPPVPAGDRDEPAAAG